ncbi:MAG: penicillin acylase family protein, partial [Myxococcota bacterium]|nr:penicillin acylase family protein [Myxococcota bacterium]
WYFGSFFAPGFRAKRISEELERLSSRGEVELADMQQLQLDVHSTLADDLLPLLLQTWDEAGDSEELAPYRDSSGIAAVLEVLEQWDRRMARDSTGAFVFQVFLHRLTEGLVQDDIPLAFDFAMRLNPVFLMKFVKLALSGAYGETALLDSSPGVLLLEAAQATADWLEVEVGSPDGAGLVFGEVKVTDFDHGLGFGMPLFRAASDGGEDTVNVAQNIRWDGEAAEFVSSHVAVERTVARFSEDGTPELWVTYPIAGPADPVSAATATALEDHVEGRSRKFLFQRDEVEAAAVERIELRRPR